MSIHVGSFNCSGSTGTPVTVNTFPGDLAGVIFFAAPLAADDSGSLSNAGLMVGLLRRDGVGTEQAVAHSLNYAGSSTGGRCQNRTGECLRMATSSSSGTVVATGAFVTNGFELTFSATTSGAAAAVVHYIAFEDEVSMDLVTLLSPASAGGTQTVTGLAGQPKAILKFIAQHSTALPSSANTASTRWGIGFTDGTTEIGVTYAYVGAASTTAVAGWMTESFSGVQATSATQLVQSSTTSITADGWVEEWTTTPGTGYPIFAVPIWGVEAKVTSFQASTAAGAQSVAVTGLTPTAALLVSNGVTAKEALSQVSRGGVSFAELLVGATDGTNVGCVWQGAQHSTAASTAFHGRHATATRVLDFRYPNGTGSTRTASATLTGLAAAEIQLSWADNALADRPWVGVLAFGSTSTPPAPPSGGARPMVVIY